MDLINPNLTFIKYGRKKIKVSYGKLTDCVGLYDPNLQTLNLDQNLHGMNLFNTIMHELFHIIIHNEDINVNEKGEEPIAKAVGDGYTKIFKQNPKLRQILFDLF